MHRAMTIITAAALTSVAQATAITLDCPKTVEIRQTISTSDTSWEQAADPDLPPAALLTVSVYIEHPSESASLMPEMAEKTEHTDITIWRLPPDSAPYWMACIYINSRTLLAKKLPLTTKQCRLTETGRGQPDHAVQSFTCE
jgi:hypothetical protein